MVEKKKKGYLVRTYGSCSPIGAAASASIHDARQKARVSGIGYMGTYCVGAGSLSLACYAPRRAAMLRGGHYNTIHRPPPGQAVAGRATDMSRDSDRSAQVAHR